MPEVSSVLIKKKKKISISHYSYVQKQISKLMGKEWQKQVLLEKICLSLCHIFADTLASWIYYFF